MIEKSIFDHQGRRLLDENLDEEFLPWVAHVLDLMGVDHLTLFYKDHRRTEYRRVGAMAGPQPPEHQTRAPSSPRYR